MGRTYLSRSARRVTAFHEAGHAIDHLAYGVPFRFISVYTVLQRGRSGIVEVPDGRVPPRIEAVIAIAGPVAEARITGRWLSGLVGPRASGRDDWQGACAALRQQGECGLAQVVDEAHALVLAHWGPIHTLAEVLMGYGRLDYHKVRRLLGPGIIEDLQKSATKPLSP